MRGQRVAAVAAVAKRCMQGDTRVCMWIRLYMYLHTAICVSAYCYICVRILLHLSAYCCMCPHTATYVSAYYCICVRILLYMCPHTAIYVSSYNYISIASAYYGISNVHSLLYLCPTYADVCCRLLTYAAVCCRMTYADVCCHSLLYLCPPTTITCVRMLPRLRARRVPQNIVRMLSAYYYICVRMLSAYCYICPHATKATSAACTAKNHTKIRMPGTAIYVSSCYYMRPLPLYI